MENLYKMAEETGMSQSQAEAAVGGVFSLIKEHVSEEHFETIAQNVPGLNDVVQKHNDSQAGSDNNDNENDDNDNDGGGLAESLLGAFSALSSGGGGATRELFDGNDDDNNEGTYRSRDGTTTATTTGAGVGGESTQEGASTATSATATSSSTQAHGQGTPSTTTGTASASSTHKVGATAGKNNSIGAVMLESVFSSLAKGKGKGGIVGGLAKLVLFLKSQGITATQLAIYLPLVAVYVKKQFGVDVSHVLGGSGTTSSSGTSSTAPHSSNGNVAGKLMGMFMK